MRFYATILINYLHCMYNVYSKKTFYSKLPGASTKGQQENSFEVVLIEKQ